MATTARLDLSVWRNDDVYEFPLRVRGMDLTSTPLAMQIRLGRDVPGAALVTLGKVTNGNAEGLRVAGTSIVDGIVTSDLRIRLNKSTRQALPYVGEVGSDTPLDYALLIDGRTRLVGDLVVLAHAYGSDGAPTNRPDGYTGTDSSFPDGGATLSIAAEDVTTIILDGAGVATAASDRAEAARTAAELAAASAVAAGRYFATRVAGEAGSTTGQLFSTNDGAGNVIYYQRTSGGSVEIGRALTPGSLVAPTGSTMIGRFGSVSAMLATNAASRGEGLIWQAAEHSYAEAPAGAADQHVTTASGVKLYVLPSAGGFSAEAFGVSEANTAAANTAILHRMWDFANGRLCRIGTGRFRYAGSYTGVVNMQGARMPTVNTDRTALENGTIFEGLTNFSGSVVILRDLGVDHGSAAFSTGADAIKLSAAPYNSGRLAVLQNVVGLGRSDTDAYHGVLVEGYARAALANCVGSTNQYCFAIKSRNVVIQGLQALGGQNGVIFKSDGTGVGSGSLSNVSASDILIEGNANTVNGIRVLSSNQSISNLTINGVNMSTLR